MAGQHRIIALTLCLSAASCSPSKNMVRISGDNLPEMPHPVRVSGESLRAAAISSVPAGASPITTIKRTDAGISQSPALGVSTTYDPVRVKFAGFLHVDPSQLSDVLLYHFIDRWLNTPYKWGGMDERGIDCSAFLQKLFSEVYGQIIPRTSLEQFLNNKVERFKSSEFLTEGDLVFFQTKQDKYISHVGLYLHNDIFVNASSSKGVSLANLNDPYWKKRYVASGRLKIRTE